MGSFKCWYEAITSTGQEALPTQAAQQNSDAATQFMNNPKNAPQLNKLATSAGHPSLLQKTALQTAMDAAKGVGIGRDQFKVNAPAIAGVMVNKLAPTVKNPFASSIKPVV